MADDEQVPASGEEKGVVSPRDGVRGPGPGPRRHPSTRGGMLYLLVLAVTVVGILLVTLVDWRVGVRVEGGALIGAAGVRLFLPQRAGMLAVRHRFFDAALLAAIGVVLIVLAGSIPDQPPPL